jgi:hypothetical protein
MAGVAVACAVAAQSATAALIPPVDSRVNNNVVEGSQ